MGGGAIEGLGSTAGFEALEPEPAPAPEAQAAAEPAAAEPQVVRGSAPPERWTAVPETGVTLVRSELEQGTAGSEAGVQSLERQAAEPQAAETQQAEATEAPRDPEEIRAELESLEALEQVYTEWLDDPELSSYERYFIELDLYDVRAEIFDLRVELGQAMADQWWDVIGMFGAGLLGVWDTMMGLLQTRSQGMLNMLDQQQDLLQQGADEARELDRRESTLAAIRRAAAQSGALVPPVSSEIMMLLDRHRDAVEQFAKSPSPEGFAAVRAAIRQLGLDRERLLAAARRQIAEQR
ncbi:MAG: hypothetical protein D6776_07600 [Planctomycetota bacterium]|nr:MAG: hypothetical protein D6776_07600 [Planctomycetota bacterium]